MVATGAALKNGLSCWPSCEFFCKVNLWDVGTVFHHKVSEFKVLEKNYK